MNYIHVREFGERFVQHRNESVVKLDCDDFFCAPGKLGGQHANTGTYFQHA